MQSREKSTRSSADGKSVRKETGISDADDVQTPPRGSDMGYKGERVTRASMQPL